MLREHPALLPSAADTGRPLSALDSARSACVRVNAAARGAQDQRGGEASPWAMPQVCAWLQEHKLHTGHGPREASLRWAMPQVCAWLQEHKLHTWHVQRRPASGRASRWSCSRCGELAGSRWRCLWHQPPCEPALRPSAAAWGSLPALLRRLRAAPPGETSPGGRCAQRSLAALRLIVQVGMDRPGGWTLPRPSLWLPGSARSGQWWAVSAGHFPGKCQPME